MAAKKTVTPENVENNEAEAPVAEIPVDPGEEYVTIQLFKDEDRYADDLYVAVNGERLLIQRGIPVTIKRKFAQVIEHSQIQDGLTDRMMARLSEDYERATREKTRD